MDVLNVLQRLGSGHLLDELSEALTATTNDVVASGKPGTVTVKFTIKGHQGESMVQIDETVTRTVPTRDPRSALFWAVEGELYQNDPRQTRMEFRELDTQTGEIKDTAYPTREERIIG